MRWGRASRLRAQQDPKHAGEESVGGETQGVFWKGQAPLSLGPRACVGREETCWRGKQGPDRRGPGFASPAAKVRGRLCRTGADITSWVC